MESRFAFLRQRDSTVDMLRLKMSRRRSQSQKENRHRALNSRRQLDKLPELESSVLDTSVMAKQSAVQERAQNVKRSAAEERVRMLARYKEAKELQKEKAKREKEKKGVFKVGLYRPPQGFQVPAAISKAKAPEMAAGQSGRVTRSMKQQPAPNKIQALPPPTERDAASAAVARKVAPAVARTTRSRATAVKAPPSAPTANRTRVAIAEVPRAPSTRSARRHQTEEASANETQPAAEACASRTRSTMKESAAPPSGREMHTQESGEAERTACPPSLTPCGEDVKMVEDPAPTVTPPPPGLASITDPAPPTQAPRPDPAPAPSTSFAPQDFVFQAPVGLSSFKPTPLTPRTAKAFLTPSISFSLPPVPLFPRDEPEAVPDAISPCPSPPRSPSRPSPPSMGPPLSPQEPQHDVAYFRSVMVSETDRLTGLSEQWDPRVDDPSIPEEMRDRMRTVVGQARLLMKERFGQFRGLVDDCELGRGEKITTCTDLQGFWEMVYYQVEDVNRKFAALKEAETRGWQEEQVKPPSRQRKGVKKPAAAASKPGGGPGANAAAKSRLAAIKAAMKAKQQAAQAEKAAQATGSAAEDTAPREPQAQDPDQSREADTVVFNGGFFRVESPAKFPGPVRRSSRVLPLPSPGPGSSLSTPARLRRSNAASPRAPPLLARTPTRLTPAGLSFSSDSIPQPTPPSRSQVCTPQSSVLLCLSPVSEASPATEAQVDRDGQSETVPEPEGVGADQTEPGHISENAEGPNGSAPPARSAPSTPARQGRAASPEVCDDTMSLTTSLYPGLPLSPPSHGPESPSLSFSLSPCPSHATPAKGPTVLPPPLPSPSLRFSPPALQLSPPALLPSPGACNSSLCDAEVPMTVTPDSSISDAVQGLDFERYLQPAARCSLSPQGTVAVEMSPAAADVDMESPVGEPGGVTSDSRMMPTAFPCVTQLFTPGISQTAERDLLFFSPYPRDRIRQSVCPKDLMSFTPPPSKS